MDESERHDYLVNIEDIMHTAYLQYSLSVNVGRAIPDVRDGLKPVTRRILYGMKAMGLGTSHTMKCARVVGEVMGKYHPHGDSSIYEALVRLAQDFSMRSILVKGQGNFGTIDGDPPAAYRYTECCMAQLGMEMLVDIDKDTVDMVPNFDASLQEPSVLPAAFPQLLVNGSVGIGVGMATNIPTHNLGEVIDATVKLLDNPAASVDDLMECLPAPDFPTRGIICGCGSIREFYRTGRGSVKLRARAEIIEKDNHEQIIVTEIPYSVSKEGLVGSIEQLRKDKKLEISEIHDYSNARNGIRIVIDVKQNAMGSVVLNQLYKHTQMEISIGCTMLVVDHNRPQVMNLVQVLSAYIEHRMEVVLRRSVFDLNKAESRKHIVDGLLKALADIDKVISIIRSSEDRADAAARLIEAFGFTDIQANAILDMRLHQLNHLSGFELNSEQAELQKSIDYLKSLIERRDLRVGVVKNELLDIKSRYNDPRCSEIITGNTDLDAADLIPRHSCVITVSNTGYIKRVPAATYRTQHRGGKGVIGMETRETDHVEHLFNADSHDIIFFFTNRGFMYWLNVYEIPEGSRISKGRAIVNMVKMDPSERICAMLTVSRDDFKDSGNYIITASRKGYIKKSELALYSNLRRTGLRALIIDDDDDLVSAAVCSNGDEVLLSTKLGQACLFDQSDDEIRPMGRSARGVRGLHFKYENDELVGMEIIREHIYSEEEITGEPPVSDEDGADAETETETEISGCGPQVLVVTDGGTGKRSYVSGYRKTHRGAKGVLNIKLRDGEKVLSVIQIVDGDEILMTTKRGQVSRISADEIRTVGRSSQGVRIMNLNRGDKLTGVTRLVKVEGGEPESDTMENSETDSPAHADARSREEDNGFETSAGEPGLE